MIQTMHAKITFPESESGRKEVIIKKVTSVSVESSWKMLTDRAKITLPRSVKFFNKNNVKQVFKAGDPVIIELGVNGELVREFTGYITRVSADIPIVISCEDEMYKLKKIPVNVSIEQCSLEELLVSILPGYDIDALDVELGTQRHPKTTVAKVLKYLQEEYNIYSYIKGGHTLVSGKIYQDDEGVKPVKVHLGKDVINNRLKYKSKDDIRIKLIAVSTLPNGDKIEVTYGDEDGEERQLSYFNIEDKEALKKLAAQDYNKYKTDGFTGSVEIYSRPVVHHGEKIKLFGDIYKDRKGTYYIDSTKVKFNNAPEYHREVILGNKV